MRNATRTWWNFVEFCKTNEFDEFQPAEAELLTFCSEAQSATGPLARWNALQFWARHTTAFPEMRKASRPPRVFKNQGSPPAGASSSSPSSSSGSSPWSRRCMPSVIGASGFS